MKLAPSLLALFVVAGTARADVWTRAIDPEPQLDIYEAMMMKGDEAATAANTRSISLANVLKNIDIAIEAYHAAAKARPSAGEPHFRIAAVLDAFFFDCTDPYNHRNLPSTCHNNVQTDRRGREALAAWDTFEALAPLDPRVNEILLKRAILRTKLVAATPKPEPLLRAAARDYQALIDRGDGFYAGNDEMVLGNLAETHMMLGDIDEAIEVYKAAIRAGGTTSTFYGLAVALDRDERTDTALKLIRAQGGEALIDFERKFRLEAIFFVPAGEEHYYFGLAYEAFGHIDQAIVHWKSFLRSGAHPKFQPRAKDHLDKLLAQKKLQIRAPLTPDLDDLLMQVRPRRRP